MKRYNLRKCEGCIGLLLGYGRLLGCRFRLLEHRRQLRSFKPLVYLPPFGQSGPADQYAGQRLQPTGICAMSAMNSPPLNVFLDVIRTLSGADEQTKQNKLKK